MRKGMGRASALGREAVETLVNRTALGDVVRQASLGDGVRQTAPEDIVRQTSLGDGLRQAADRAALYVAAVRMIMRLVVVLEAEAAGQRPE